MSDFLAMAAQYTGLIYATLALGLSLAIYFAFQYRINFWWLNFWYSIPFVGKLARLSKDTTRSSNPGWLRAEETLCSDYRKHITTTSEAEFRKRLTYMSKAQDLGRHPLPGWMVAVLAVLLVAEGLGFSYLLGTWMAREGSANVHTLLMLAIVFVICTIMLFLTHAAGHQLYRTGLIKRSDKEWRDNGQEGPLRTQEVKLDDDQVVDDSAPAFTQTVNRVGTHGSYVMVIITAIAVLAIASVSTWMRVNHLNQEMIERTAVQGGSTGDGNPFASGNAPAATGNSAVPAELAKPQQEADMKAKAESLSNEKGEGLAAFIMLALIFVVTQIVGIYAGYKYGFAGKESAAAYRGTRGYATYDDYMDRFEPMIQVGQAKLQTLQRNLSALGGNVRLSLNKTFDDFIRDAEARRRSRREATSGFGASVAKASVSVDPKPVLEAVTLQEALARIAVLTTSDERKAYVAALPELLKAQVIEHRRAELKREEQQRQAAQQKDVDELF